MSEPFNSSTVSAFGFGVHVAITCGRRPSRRPRSRFRQASVPRRHVLTSSHHDLPCCTPRIAVELDYLQWKLREWRLDTWALAATAEREGELQAELQELAQLDADDEDEELEAKP
jgi:hypothetical protein